jgi:L-ascorbate metabolism protein UlaG (beta-lactamase superfamily)
MFLVTTNDLKRVAIRVAIGILTILAVGIAALVLMWRDRLQLADIELRPAPVEAQRSDTVTATWFGVSTLLFDDGQTQILIDGFISRPTLSDILLQRPVDSDAAMINYALNEYRLGRLAAIIPVHSHFDHAMDIGAIANRTSASILGSESTAHIARGAGVPEDQIVVVSSGAEYSFGDFSVKLIESVHGPVGWRGQIPLAGSIDEPLVPPAPVVAWRAGRSYSIVISHPLGTTIVQGSVGFIEGALDDVQADVVMLGVGLLERLGRDYAQGYWQALVTATGAQLVFPIHFDDYTRPYGEIELIPKVLDNFAITVQWLEEFRAAWDLDTQLFMPVFGQPILLYPAESPEA